MGPSHAIIDKTIKAFIALVMRRDVAAQEKRAQVRLSENLPSFFFSKLFFNLCANVRSNLR